MQISLLNPTIERGEFSMRFISARGEVIIVDKCVCTSIHSSGHTLNIKLCESGEVRKVNRWTIIEVNGEELHL